MLGLFMLFVLAVQIGLTCFWFACLYRLFNWLGDQGKILGHLSFRVPVLLILLIAPFHNALVSPFMKKECISNGGAITYEKQNDLPEAILLEKVSSELASMETVTTVFQQTPVKSVHSTPDINGIDQNIRNFATLNKGKTTALSISEDGDINCGPFYYYVAHYQSDSDLEKIRVPTSKCLTIGGSQLPASYIKVTNVEQNQSSWRQIFHPINWKIVRYEKIVNGVSILLAEIREFKHIGFRFPFFSDAWFSIWSFGDYSCKATKTPLNIFSQVLNLNDRSIQSADSKWTKELGLEKFLDVKNRAMGFPLPDNVFVHDIMVYVDDRLSTKSRPLNINLTVFDHGLPVLLLLNSASQTDLKWNVSTVWPNQKVFAQFSWQKEDHPIVALGETQLFGIFETNDNTPDIQKFYLQEFSGTRFKGAVARKVVRVHKNGIDVSKNEITFKLGPNDPKESEILFGTYRSQD